MGAVNPYQALGVEPHASPRDIRRAYHALALRFHPDAASDESGERFAEIHEAYRLLSNPDARADHDRAHQGYAQRRHQREFGLPLSLALFDVAGDVCHGALETSDLLGHGFVHEGIGHHEPEQLHYDLSLSADEAARGGRFSFRIPVRRHCRACTLAGRWSCQVCGGDGFVVDEPEIDVLVPPGVHDGARADVWLGPVGIEGGLVDVTVRVE